ncbi:MAG: hypothetical protein ACRD3M_18715 [Thermoanaerobaculia bacterium]
MHEDWDPLDEMFAAEAQEEHDRMWMVIWGAAFGAALGYFLSVWGLI